MVIVLTWPVTVITEVIGVGVHVDVEEELGSEAMADDVDEVERVLGVWEVWEVLGDGLDVVVSITGRGT